MQSLKSELSTLSRVEGLAVAVGLYDWYCIDEAVGLMLPKGYLWG